MLKRRSLLAGAAAPLVGGCGARSEIEGGFTGASPQRGHLLRSASAQGAGAAPALHRTRVVIAGGGVAGLAAARALRLRGIDDFVLLELEDDAGGNSRAGLLGGIACPLGAHYLPVPGDDAPEVQNLLEELGLRRRVAGRWRYDERHLCHSPQERLYFRGAWQEGLLPLQDVGAATLAQYRRFGARVAQLGAQERFAMPSTSRPPAAAHRALAAQTMLEWLQHEGLDDAHLRWYLDYCCRDDYGAGIAAVSAWAGIHYFASRHGFALPGESDSGGREAVLTWPEGNGWLVRRLAAPLGDRLRCGKVVLRIEEMRHGVQVQAIDAATGAGESWQAQHCIVALPMLAAARVVDSAPPILRARAAAQRHAPWVVVNLQLKEPLRDRPGAAPAWDNVLYGTPGLGYVDARHQALDPRPGPTVLSWYLAPGEAARTALLERGWQHWSEQAIGELAPAHADLREKLQRVAVARYGHAMAIPVPGGAAGMGRKPPHSARLSYAHSDWAGYSVFEEAFTLGHLAAAQV